jgi:uncharacterized protein (DUF885 family)
LRLLQAFTVLPKASVEIRRVPTYLEAGAPPAYYQDPSLDGTRPGVFYLNLRDTTQLPNWVLPTTTFHETNPGHHLQQALAQERATLPLIRKVLWSRAYGEGWAMYAEQLSDELGLYGDDPWGRIGYTWAALLRACRLVVDTGLHAKRWSREQAIAWMTSSSGAGTGMITAEIERYCVQPGNACSYMVGKSAWTKLRERAQLQLGARFDLREFHDVGLLSGAVPLVVLEQLVDSYIARHKRA